MFSPRRVAPSASASSSAPAVCSCSSGGVSAHTPSGKRRNIHKREEGETMRILVAECKQEVSSFNPALSHREDFHFSHGADILSYHRGGQNEVAGALSVFDARLDVELVPTFSA